MTDKTCFVVMGFGKKTDFPTGRTLDLDKSYRIIIKPAVEAAGLRCVRADDMVSAGTIDLTMYQQLLEADVVVADISTCNPNALYELGVRHALRPYTTITIAEEQLVYPFDVSHIVVRRYQHLGAGIDAEEAQRFGHDLTEAVRTLVAQTDPDSPVYTYLAGLRPPRLEEIVGTPAPTAAAVPPADDQTLSGLTEAAELAMEAGRFVDAKAMFLAARNLRRDDSLTQRLALATYKSAVPTEVESLMEARTILGELKPEVSNDPETLGLWGAVHKRLWTATHEREHLDTAIHAYACGFDLRTDYYNGINLALLLNMRARVSPPAEMIADFIAAERVRRRVIPLCHAHLEGTIRDENDRYWACATLGEAYLGIGDRESGEMWLKTAAGLPVATWMRESTDKQIAFLRDLLEPSPLDLIQVPAAAG